MPNDRPSSRGFGVRMWLQSLLVRALPTQTDLSADALRDTRDFATRVSEVADYISAQPVIPLCGIIAASALKAGPRMRRPLPWLIARVCVRNLPCPAPALPLPCPCPAPALPRPCPVRPCLQRSGIWRTPFAGLCC